MEVINYFSYGGVKFYPSSSSYYYYCYCYLFLFGTFVAWRIGTIGY